MPICDLGAFAPPYIVIACGIAMISIFLNVIKGYQNVGSDILNTKILHFFRLRHYLYSFAVACSLLVTTSIVNLFTMPCISKHILELIIKVALGWSAFCSLYSFVEGVRERSEEKLLQETIPP